MPDIQFPDASPYNPNVKFGERPSAFDFVPNQYWSGIRAGSVTADLSGWIQDGLYSLGGVGGGIFYMPWGVYPVKDIDCPAGVEIVGDGRRRTFLKRMATLPPGRGVLNFAGNGSAVRKLAIDGMVTDPAHYTYAELSDPMEDKLTVDTSIWIHGGASDITIEQTLIYHTGGYAIAVDARTGDIRRVLVSDADFENNRPHLAGPVGDMTAGGWGGGVHYQGDGHLYAVDGLHVDKSRFRRGTGNQLWGHLYDFGKLHTDIKATGCHFSDIGRDGIMLGGVSGGVVSDCHFRRVGYVCTDDTAPIGTPKWVSNQWAVALDTAGLVRGVNYTNNTFLNCLGACMDGDGYAEGTVNGNICRVSKPDEPEYVEDNIAAWPRDPEKPSASYCYGFQTSNSNGIDWSARGVNITGNYFYNLGLGAIRLYSARKCSVWGNTIWHPDEALAVPILMGNIGAGENQRAHDNTIGENTVHWNPTGESPVVFEDKNTFAFAGTDKNWVAGQRMFGTGMYEFRKDADTSSVTGRLYSSNVGGLTSRSENYLQREDGYLRMYGGTDVLFTLLDRHAITEIGTGIVGGPMFNVSLNGAGGVISTGGRTVIPIDDCVATGVLASDSFLSMTQKFVSGSFVYEDAKANLFDANFGLMRYNPTTKKFQVSSAGGAAAGARVWVDLGAGSGPGGPDQAVQWNDGGIFGGSADFLFNRTTKLLLVTTAIATGARSALPISDVMATGVLYADQFSALTYTAPFLDAKADLFDSNTGLMRYNAAVKKFQISTAGGGGAGPRVWVDMATGGATVPGGPDQAVQWNDNGAFGGDADLLFNRTSKILLSRLAMATGDRSALSLTDIMATGILYGDTFLSLTNTTWDDAKANLLNDNWGLIRYVRADKKFQISTSVTAGPARVWTDLYTGGAIVPGAPLQSVQFNDNGAFAGDADFSWNKTSNTLVVVGAIGMGVRTALPMPDLIASGVMSVDNFSTFTDSTFDGTKANLFDGNYGLLRFDKTLKKFQISTTVTTGPNARVWVDLYTGGAVVPGGVTGSVQYKTATGTFGGDDFIKWDSVARLLTVTGDTNNAPSIYSAYGWIQSEHGFYSPMPVSDNVVNIPNGGVTARNLISIRDDEGPSLKLARTTASGGQSADFQWRIDTMGAMVLKDSKNALDRLTLEQNGTFSFSGGDTNYVDISSTSGFVLASTSVSAPLLRASNANDTAIQATAGGIQVKSGVQAGQALYLKAYPDPLAGLNPPPTTEFGTAAAFGGIAYKGGTQYRVWNGGSWVTVDFATVGGGVTSITGTAHQVYASQATGAVTLSLPQNIHTSADVAFSNLTLTNRLYFANPGGDANIIFYIGGLAGNLTIVPYAPTPTATGAGIALYSSTPAGAITGRVFINPYGKTIFDPTGVFANDASGSVLQIVGYATASVGFTVPSSGTAADAIQAKWGGVWANKITADMALYMKSTAASSSLANPTGYGGFAHKSGTEYWIWNGSAWVTINLATVGGGVTSITGTVDQVYAYQPTGAVQLFLPQNIAPTSDVVFNSVTAANRVAFGNVSGNGNNQFTISVFASGMYFNAISNPGADIGTSFYFRNAPAGGGYTERLRIIPNGSVVIGAGPDTDGSGAKLLVTGLTSSSIGFYTGSAHFGAIQVPLGGVYVTSGHFLKYVHMAGNPGVPPATSGTPGVAENGWFYYDSGLQKFRAYEGSVWKDMISVGSASAGALGLVQFSNGGGGFAADGSFFWNNTQKALRLGPTLHTGATFTAMGNIYLGARSGNFDYLCIYNLAGYETRIQTCTDGQSVEVLAASNPTPATDQFYILRLQPLTGRVQIGPVTQACTFSVSGNAYIVNNNAGNYPLLVQGAAGQTQNLTEWRTSGGSSVVAINPAGDVFGSSFNALALGAAAGGASATGGKYLGREIRFAQSGTGGHEADAGRIAFRTLDDTCLAIVGYGTTNVNRVVKLFDDVIVIRNAYVNGSLGSGSLYSSLFDLSLTPDPGLSAAGKARLWTDGTALWASTGGSAKVNLMAAGGGAVASVTGGTGVTASPTTGAVVVSIGQSVATTAGVTFGSVQANGAIQATVAVNSVAFQANGGNVQIWGNGNLNGAGFLNFTQGLITGGGIECRGVNPRVSGSLYTGQDWEVYGTFVINGGNYTKLTFKGGILVGV